MTGAKHQLAGSKPDSSRSANWDYARGLGRAFGGATVFSLPLLLTMEMWWLGFYLPGWAILQLSLVNFVLLVGLSRVSGFEPTASAAEDLLDAFAAYAVAVASAAVLLWLIGVIGSAMPAQEVAGKIAVQAVPASFGAMIAGKQFSSSEEKTEQQERWRSTYGGQLFLMVAGALFLCLTVAPTEEMILISFKMSSWHSFLLVLLSIAMLHAFVYSVGFAGQVSRGEGETVLGTVLRFTLPGYAIAVAVSLYILWTFGRTAGVGLDQIAMMVTVLAFPAALGAAIARLVI